MEHLIGIDIGGTKCAVVRGNALGEVAEKTVIPTTNFTETFEKILNVVDTLEGKSIGISCGGPLDEKRGIIQSPPNLPGWDDIPIIEMLENRYKIPCAIRNDANACALAEWKFGAGRGTQNMIFMTFGTGLGAGVILNGRLYAGTSSMAGEVGHIRLAEYGPAGYGKCGSFEGFCSGSGLHELGRGLARAYIQRGVSPAFIKDKNVDAFTVAEMADAARGGDACALEAFDICATMLGRGLAILGDILNPEMIIIGSVYARCRDLLEEKAKAVMKREALPAVYACCAIKAPELGERIGDAAALAVAAEVFEERGK